ncbi:hypothetical protein BpHYR1_054407, partial [Brachionus plicatilis]
TLCNETPLAFVHILKESETDISLHTRIRIFQLFDNENVKLRVPKYLFPVTTEIKYCPLVKYVPFPVNFILKDLKKNFREICRVFQSKRKCIIGNSNKMHYGFCMTIINEQKSTQRLAWTLISLKGPFISHDCGLINFLPFPGVILAKKISLLLQLKF